MDSLMELGLIPFVKLSLGMVGAVIFIMILMRYLPQTSVLSGLTNANVSGDCDEEGNGVASSLPVAIGQEGVALTELRPSGKAEFDGQYYEVMARDGFQNKGTALHVVAVQSDRLIVEAK